MQSLIIALVSIFVCEESHVLLKILLIMTTPSIAPYRFQVTDFRTILIKGRTRSTITGGT